MQLRLSFRVVLLLRCASKKLLDAWHGAASRHRAGFNGFIRAIEVVPRKRLNVRAKDQVRVPLPDFQLVLLCRAHRPAHDLKDVGGRAAVAVLNTDRAAEHNGGAEIGGRARWHWSHQSAVRKAARPHSTRPQDSGEATNHAK